MGNEETKNEIPNNSSFHILDYGYCRVWKRKEDEKEIMEEYPVYHESEERLKLFENVWELRKNHELFVNVYHFQHEETGVSCSISAKGSLFTERIPFRLSEFGKIKYPEIAKIMKTCIEGYKELYEYYGAFVIRSTMIGFTQAFQVKLWVHTDFSEPEPENPNCNRVQDMFASLINAVESTSEQLYYNCPKFSEFIVKTNYIYFSKDFDTLLQGLSDYVEQLDIRVPHDLGNLKFCFKKPEGWEKFKIKNNYPQLIGSQDEIPSEISSVYELTEKNMEIKTPSKNTIELSSSKLSLSFPTNYTVETSNRMLFSKLEPDPYHLQPQNHQIFQSSFPKNNKVLVNKEVQQNKPNQLSELSLILKQKKDTYQIINYK